MYLNKLLISLLLIIQTDPYTGTYTSNQQTLRFLDNEKCTLTIQTAWHGSEERGFKWQIIGKDTLELRKHGFVKYSFKKIEIKNLSYLVKLESLDIFTNSIRILQEESSNNSDSAAKERFLIAQEVVSSMLKK